MYFTEMRSTEFLIFFLRTAFSKSMCTCLCEGTYTQKAKTFLFFNPQVIETRALYLLILFISQELTPPVRNT